MQNITNQIRILDFESFFAVKDFSSLIGLYSTLSARILILEKPIKLSISTLLLTPFNIFVNIMIGGEELAGFS